MTTTATQEKNLAAQKLDAEVREAEARLEVLQAQAEVRKATEDLDRISGLTAAKERVKKTVAEFKQFAAEDYAATKRDAEKAVNALKAEVQHISERYTAWDDAATRRLTARLDEADARLKVWTAQVAREDAERDMMRHDALATLEEKIALVRARAAEARHQKYSAKAQAALEDAAYHFNQAYDAAATRYEKK